MSQQSPLPMSAERKPNKLHVIAAALMAVGAVLFVVAGMVTYFREGTFEMQQFLFAVLTGGFAVLFYSLGKRKGTSS